MESAYISCYYVTNLEVTLAQFESILLWLKLRSITLHICVSSDNICQWHLGFLKGKIKIRKVNLTSFYILIK